MFALPSRSAPASRSRAATKASWGAIDPRSAVDPAVVVIRSAVSMLSFSRMGMPCSGPRGPEAWNSRSRASAISSASGFTSRTANSRGPWRFSASMRSRYISVIERQVYSPVRMPSWTASIVISSRAKSGTPPGALSCPPSPRPEPGSPPGVSQPPSATRAPAATPVPRNVRRFISDMVHLVRSAGLASRFRKRRG